ncbi:hypothetical protein ACET3Z_023573 [Daucus carota]
MDFHASTRMEFLGNHPIHVKLSKLIVIVADSTRMGTKKSWLPKQRIDELYYLISRRSRDGCGRKRLNRLGHD